MTKHSPLAPGETFHLLGALTIPVTASRSVPGQRGAEFLVTAEMLAAATDRNGDSFLNLVDDEPGQVARWGKVLIARGPVPESVQWWDTGNDADRSLARSLEMEASAAFTHPAERAAEQKRILQKYGQASTSQSLDYRPGAA